MATTTFPTTVDSFPVVADTDTQEAKLIAAVTAIETAIGANKTIVNTADAQTLTNKRVQKRVVRATTSTAMNPANYDVYVVSVCTGSATMTFGAGVVGDELELILLGAQTGIVHVTDQVGAINFTAAKSGSVRFRCITTGTSANYWHRVGAHYQES